MTNYSPAPMATPTEADPSTDHKVVGTLFVVSAFVFLAVGGMAGALAKEDVGGTLELVSDRTFRHLFNMPGLVLVMLVVLPLWLGLASALVPLQIGATRLAFPRVHAFALWAFVAGGVMLLVAPRSSDLVRGMELGSVLPDSAAFRDDGSMLALLGLLMVLGAAVVVAVNLATTVLALRAPGLTLARVPMFSFSVLVSALVMLLAVPVVAAALVMLLVDGHYGGRIFNGFTGSKGGIPLLWPRIFWFGAYPFLWALLLPALGAVADIVPVFARRRLFSHHRAVAAVTGVGVLAFFGWGSQVPSLSRARVLFALAVLAGLLPVASLVANWLMTMRGAGGRRRVAGAERKLSVPMIGALGTSLLVLSGLALGAASAFNAGGDFVSYWWSGEQHLLFVAAPLVAATAALHYWAPKLWGRSLSAGTGGLTVLALTGGALLAFFLPQFLLGAQDIGLDLDSFTAADGWDVANVISSIGMLAMALGSLALAVDLVVNVVAGRGRRATDDPWGGHTLEWATTSPPPPLNFVALPEIRSEAPLLDLTSTDTDTEPDDLSADDARAEPVGVA